MFQKGFYANYCKQGKKMKNLFDENVIADLQNMNNTKATENVRKEALFQFFKNKNILKEEYILNMFHQQKGCLIDYDFFEHTFEKERDGEDARRIFFLTLKNNSDKEENRKKENAIHIFPTNSVKEMETAEITKTTKGITGIGGTKGTEGTEGLIKKETDNIYINTNIKTITNNKENVKTQIGVQEEDFILYYPLYFRSVYNHMCEESRKEKTCYEYNNMNDLCNNKNNEIKEDIPFTVFHGKQKGCVDYIFYSYKNVDMISCSELPSFEKLFKWGCLPNQKYSSSDHLYLHATMIRKN